jgi:hypothetical protein
LALFFFYPMIYALAFINQWVLHLILLEHGAYQRPSRRVQLLLWGGTLFWIILLLWLFAPRGALPTQGHGPLTVERWAGRAGICAVQQPDAADGASKLERRRLSGVLSGRWVLSGLREVKHGSVRPSPWPRYAPISRACGWKRICRLNRAGPQPYGR